MNFTESELIQGLVGTLMAYGIYLLKDIAAQLSKINNTMSSLSQWTLDHEVLDTERNASLREEVTECKQQWIKHACDERADRNRRVTDNCPLDDGGK